jgi:hypothetical protein
VPNLETVIMRRHSNQTNCSCRTWTTALKTVPRFS